MFKQGVFVLLGLAGASAMLGSQAHTGAPQALLIVGEGPVSAAERTIARALGGPLSGEPELGDPWSNSCGLTRSATFFRPLAQPACNFCPFAATSK